MYGLEFGVFTKWVTQGELFYSFPHSTENPRGNYGVFCIFGTGGGKPAHRGPHYAAVLQNTAIGGKRVLIEGNKQYCDFFSHSAHKHCLATTLAPDGGVR